jgi:hypothetical protein
MFSMSECYLHCRRGANVLPLIRLDGDNVHLASVGIVPVETWPIVKRITLWNAFRTWWMNRGAAFMQLPQNNPDPAAIMIIKKPKDYEG